MIRWRERKSGGAVADARREGMHYSTSASYSRLAGTERLQIAKLSARPETLRFRINRVEGNGVAKESPGLG